MNGLAVAASNSADVALPQLHFEDRHFAVRNFRQHHVVRKFHELSNDELEEFLHVDSGGGGGVSVAGGVIASAVAAAGSVSTGGAAGAGFAAAAGFFCCPGGFFFAPRSRLLV